MKLIFTILLAMFLAFSALAQTPEELIKRGNEQIKSKETIFDGLRNLVAAKSAYLEQAQPLMEKKESAKAIEILNKAIAINADFNDVPPKEEFIVLKFADRDNTIAAYQNRMLSYFRLEKYDEAIADATWLIDHKPKLLANIYFFRGVSYYNKDDNQKALPDFKLAIRFNPKDAQNYFYVGKIYLEQENWKLSIANLSKTLLLDPKFNSVFGIRGFAYLKDGQFKNAITDLNKAISFNPDNVFLYYRRGMAYKGLSFKQRALADFRKVLTMEPDFADARKAIEEMDK